MAERRQRQQCGSCACLRFDGGSWIQLGGDIDGEAADNRSGYSVALSGDGNTLVVGAPFNDGNGGSAGQARVYDWDGSAWVQRGVDIDGEAAGDKSGCSVALSGDGNTLVVGATGSDAGQARVFMRLAQAITVTGTIQNDDSATVTIADNANDANETGSVAGKFTVTQTTQFDRYGGGLQRAGRQHGDRWRHRLHHAQRQVTILAGDTTADIDVTGINDDSIVEADETVIVQLNSITSGDPQISVDTGNDTATVTILDNDTATVSIANANDANETGSVAGKFTVTQSTTSSTDTVVGYSVLVGSTATDGGTDYTTLSGSVTILAGDTTADIDVTGINDDSIVEADETVIVQLNSVTSGDPQISVDTGNDTATVTIENGDTAKLSINDVLQVETDSGTTSFVFTISSDLVASEDLSVTVNTADLVQAVAGTDYAAITNQTATILTGDLSTTVSVIVIGENLAEIDETFEVKLSDPLFDGVSDPSRVVIEDGSGLGTIENDDFAPIANPGGSYVINEGDSLSLDSSASTDVDDGFSGLTFRWDVDGDGDYDENITTSTPTLTWLQLNALDDPINDGPDGPRTIAVEASDGTNIDTALTTLTVNNVAPEVTVDNPNQTDGDDEQYSDSIDVITFTATDVAADPLSATIEYSTDGGMSYNGINVMPDAGTVSGGLTFSGADDQVSPATWTIDGIADLAPGTYTFRIAVNDGDGGITQLTTDLVVEQEDAIPNYIGQTFTYVDNNGVLNLELRTIVQDITFFGGTDVEGGDITRSDIPTATVTYLITPDSGGPATTITVNVEPIDTDPLTGVAVATFTDTFANNQDTEIYIIEIFVDEYYVGDTDTIVTATRPDGSFITGGGYITEDVSYGEVTTFGVADPYAALEDGSKINFGYNVKWNKSLTNLQGQFNLIARAEDGSKWHIKSTATRTLGVEENPDGDPDTDDFSAVFTSKANLKNIGGGELEGLSGIDMIVSIHDNGEPGSSAADIPDTIGVELWDGSTLIFSTHWNGSETLEQDLIGGNNQVHAPNTKGNKLEIEAGTITETGQMAGSLTETVLGAMGYQAVEIWAAAGVSAEGISLMDAVDLLTEDLSYMGGVLGLAMFGEVTIDDDAVGYGWFIDDLEDPYATDTNIVGVDLLTVMLHEYGHILGFAHNDIEDDIMNPTLSLGQRKLPEVGYQGVMATAEGELQLGGELNLGADALRLSVEGQEIPLLRSRTNEGIEVHSHKGLDVPPLVDMSHRGQAAWPLIGSTYDAALTRAELHDDLLADRFELNSALAVDACFDVDDERSITKRRGGAEKATEARFLDELDQLMATLGESDFLCDDIHNPSSD